jgi:hypothetical protein
MRTRPRVALAVALLLPWLVILAWLCSRLR